MHFVNSGANIGVIQASQVIALEVPLDEIVREWYSPNKELLENVQIQFGDIVLGSVAVVLAFLSIQQT